MLGTLGFDEKGDVTGIEMWSWYRWENGTVVEKAPSELPPTEKPIWGLLFFSVFPYQKKKVGRGLGNPPRKPASSSPPRQSSASMIVNTRVFLLRSAGSSEPNSILAS